MNHLIGGLAFLQAIPLEQNAGTFLQIHDRLVLAGVESKQGLFICTKHSTSSGMRMMSFSEVRANLKAVMDLVVADKAPVSITRARGQEGVVLISESEWASIEETLYLLQSPRNAERLLNAIRGLEAGEGEEHTLIET